MDFTVVRLRVDEAKSHGWRCYELKNEELDEWEVFLFDENVVAWGKTLDEVDGVVKKNMTRVRKQWRKLGRQVRKEKMKVKGWDGMEGKENYGWNTEL